MPLVVGAEASGEIAAIGDGVTRFKPGQKVVMYGALTCGVCPACKEGRDNLCENVGGIMGFHVDGFARELLNLPARLVIPVPPGVSMRDAACAPTLVVITRITFLKFASRPLVSVSAPRSMTCSRML